MNRRELRRNRRRGFTLMEVLLVLAILGVIAAMVVPNLLGTQKKAYIDATQGEIKRVEGTIRNYAIQYTHGEFPQGSDQEALAPLLEPREENGVTIPRILDAYPHDAWEQPLHYKYPGDHNGSDKPDIWSSGPNQKDENGGGDDIVNWEKESS